MFSWDDVGKNILKKSGEGYWLLNSTSLTGDIFVNFLTSDVVIPSKWIAWLNNSQCQYTSSNLTQVEKAENDTIELSDLFSEDGPCLAIKKSRLIELIHQWETITKQRPHYIVITIDGNDIKMTGTHDMEFPNQSFIAAKHDTTYWLKKSSAPLGWLWWKFLSKDVNSDAAWWVRWFNDPTIHELSDPRLETYVRITKKDDDVILGEMHTPDGPNYVFNKQNIIDVITAWDELCKKNTPYIVVTITGQHVHIEGKSSIEQ